MEVDTSAEDESDEDDEILDEGIDVDKSELADAPEVQFSTGELTKYEISEPGVLVHHQRLCKINFYKCPLSNGKSDKSYIK